MSNRVLMKLVEMIETLVHNNNEQYLDLSKRLKKVEDRVITSAKDIVEVLAPVKEFMETFAHDLENLHKLALEIKVGTSKSQEFESG